MIISLPDRTWTKISSAVSISYDVPASVEMTCLDEFNLLSDLVDSMLKQDESNL